MNQEELWNLHNFIVARTMKEYDERMKIRAFHSS